MQVNEADPGTLRSLAELRPGRGKVLSLFLNLEPSEFATAAARASEITSLCDAAERRSREAEGLGHDERAALREDVERTRRLLSGPGFARGAHALAVYCCGPADLFEAIRLPRAVDPAVVIDDVPAIEPLARFASDPSLCVALVNRRTTRLLRGSLGGLTEVQSFQDDVPGHHDQGGWSQARYQRSIEEEVDDHLRRTADALARHLRRRPCDYLLVGAPEELAPSLESRLPNDTRARLAGRVDVDVESTSPDDVLSDAMEVIEDQLRRRERDALDRLAQGVGADGRATAGLDEVLSALYERKVQALLYEPGVRRPGSVCPRCGWMASSDGACPVDGAQMERREDVTDPAVAAALRQSAEVMAVRHHPDLGPLGRIGALLRF